jgi:hypothetical protein
VPVGGKSTDANGNATFDLGLERTGEWRDVKVSASLPAPAEWALFTGGSPLTFGRGRRVTLGPELLEPFDTLQLAVTGGPPSQPIVGAVTGKAGSMEEIVSAYAPAPNTIALDTSGFLLLTDSIDTAGGSGFKNYPMLPGAQTVMVTINRSNGTRSVNPTQLNVECQPSDFFPIQAGGAVLNLNPRQLGLVNPEDTKFTVLWTMAGANPLNVLLDVAVFSTNLLAPQNVAFQFDSSANLRVTMDIANPAAWQSATAFASTTAAAVGTTTLVGAVAGQTIRVFGWSLASDGVAAGGVRTHIMQHGAASVIAWFSASPVGAVAGSAGPVPLAVGTALDFVVDFLPAGDTALAAVTYSQA